MQFVSTGDLVKRWKYTRQGINVLAKRPDFPPVAFRVNNDRLPVWELAAIEAFEKGKPELGDEAAKLFKVKGYAISIQKGDRKRAGLPDGNSPEKPVGSTEITPLEHWLEQPATPRKGRA